MTDLGREAIRISDLNRSTGQMRFSSDIYRPGNLAGVVVRSPIAHGRLMRLDVDAALRMPGVQTIVTADDIPGVKFVGKMVQEGWSKSAKRHNLDMKISGIYPLGHFTFNHKESLTLKTLFAQLMLEKGFLATNSFYASYAHKECHIKDYLKAVDSSFGFIAKAAREKNPKIHLKGPVCHSGFRRLA